MRNQREVWCSGVTEMKGKTRDPCAVSLKPTPEFSAPGPPPTQSPVSSVVMPTAETTTSKTENSSQSKVLFGLGLGSGGERPECTQVLLLINAWFMYADKDTSEYSVTAGPGRCPC